MGLLDGKKILVTGVLNDDSIAFGVARLVRRAARPAMRRRRVSCGSITSST